MSTLTAENILILIEQLPDPERARFYQLLPPPPVAPTKAPLDKIVPPMPMQDHTREFDWIEAHKDEYAGQWVALDGDHLIAASPIEREVWEAVKAARTAGGNMPLVHRVSSPSDLPYIGI
jgi:hypothetical protein